MVTTSENDANAYFTFSWEVVLKLKTTTLMKHLGGIGFAWFMLSGYSGPHTWWFSHGCGGYHLRVHLWLATQETRDYHVFHALVSFQCSLMTLWALS